MDLIKYLKSNDLIENKVLLLHYLNNQLGHKFNLLSYLLDHLFSLHYVHYVFEIFFALFVLRYLNFGLPKPFVFFSR